VKTTIKTCTYCKSPFDNNATHICSDTLAPDDLSALLQPQIGMIIDKKYRLENKLGEGGMGSVFRARRLFIDDFVAVKFVRPEVLSNPEFRQRFYQEAKVAARIKHPNVVTIHDFGETPDGIIYLVMEFLEGLSLGELLKKKSTLPLEQVIEIGLQIGEALHYMHENNVIHRDLKPDNIMLVQDGKGVEVVKVVDFGVAKILESNARLTRYQARIGSPVYCSPEQYLGEPVDHRTDLYGLGIIFYECLAGYVPFDAMSETELRAAILHKMPPRLDEKAKDVTGHAADLVQWLLAKDPNDRPHNAAELNKCLHALRRTLKHKGGEPEENFRLIPLRPAKKARPAKPAMVNFDEVLLFPNLDLASDLKIENSKTAVASRAKIKSSRASAAPRRKAKSSGKKVLQWSLFLGLVSVIVFLIWAKLYAPAMPMQLITILQQAVARVEIVLAETMARANQAIKPESRPTKPLPIGVSANGGISATIVSPASLPPSAISLPKEKSEATAITPNAERVENKAAELSLVRREAAQNAMTAGNTRRENEKIPARADKVSKPPASFSPIRVAMVLVKETEFKRGDLFGDGNPNEKPAHLVRVKDFLIGKHEVTNREYMAFVNATGRHLPEWMNPNSKYYYQTGTDTQYKMLGAALYNLDHPVVGVSWEDAVEYCVWLSQQSSTTYRLPTETEWELAARGGNNVLKYSWGNGTPLLALGGNVGDEALKKVFPDWRMIWRNYNDTFVFTAPVGKFGGNVLGIYDMTGNVAEWCSDWYDANSYQKKEWDNPRGSLQGVEKVIRGGSWNDTPPQLRVSNRRSAPPIFRSNNLGFRVAAKVR